MEIDPFIFRLVYLLLSIFVGYYTKGGNIFLHTQWLLQCNFCNYCSAIIAALFSDDSYLSGIYDFYNYFILLLFMDLVTQRMLAK